MLQIGQFARLGRVSVKTLRHYDEIGLLRPSHIDRQSGYRFYAAAQLVTLARILQLKELGLPLAAIARSDPAAHGPSLQGVPWSERFDPPERRARRRPARGPVDDRLAA
ncbi:MAG: MerR family transcriptional regulator [Aphanocapsa lilacina HA4352-LM1]|jgi:DNA-binding transcriptional MerR regulator|nr:MerR family transcriptional regulator [Aphanocapsa lilacina HA4352-LM1]